MNSVNREPIIAGNWKMNKTPIETKNFITQLVPLVNSCKCGIILCVPYIDLAAAKELSAMTNIKIGAQNCNEEKQGAFTGEVSAFMLKEVGVEYVIIGHSERRTLFAETDIAVNKKIKAAVENNLNVIFCVGETLAQREQNITFETIASQIKIGLKGLEKDALEKIIIAYEPVWAIGTGKTATPLQAEEVCLFIRKTIEALYDKSVADNIIIQYGGSMNPENTAELMAMPNIDGGLIGGASLNVEDFSKIIKIASR